VLRKLPGQADEEGKRMTRATVYLCTIVVAMVLSASLCAGQQVSSALTNKEIIEMVSLGLSNDLIVDKIHATDATDFDTSMEGLKSLKAANVSDVVIRAMVVPHPAIAANTDSTAAQEQPPQPDPNDPNTPHDPGIYIYAKTKDGPKMLPLEPTVYSEGKTSGVAESAFTFGIAKVKFLAVVQGPNAGVKTADSNMVFYFYFEEPGTGLTYASYDGPTSPNEFALVKFVGKKDSRETVVMTANMFGTSSGTDQKSSVHFSFTKLRPGVYKVTPNAPLLPGEYCFLSSAGLDRHGPGSAGANRLFDFAVTSTP
jgi:hypothetical protein